MRLATLQRFIVVPTLAWLLAVSNATAQSPTELLATMPLDFSRPVRIELECKARSGEKAMLFIRYLKD
jgi:hypothetical protein